MFKSSSAPLNTTSDHQTTYKLVFHPLHATNERLVPDGVGDHGFDVDGERLFEQNHVVLRQPEGVHVARVEFPAGVHGSYFLGLGKHSGWNGGVRKSRSSLNSYFTSVQENFC